VKTSWSQIGLIRAPACAKDLAHASLALKMNNLAQRRIKLPSTKVIASFSEA
jgi:hypothetical protein